MDTFDVLALWKYRRRKPIELATWLYTLQKKLTELDPIFATMMHLGDNYFSNPLDYIEVKNSEDYLRLIEQKADRFGVSIGVAQESENYIIHTTLDSLDTNQSYDSWSVKVKCENKLLPLEKLIDISKTIIRECEPTVLTIYSNVYRDIMKQLNKESFHAGVAKYYAQDLFEPYSKYLSTFPQVIMPNLGGFVLPTLEPLSADNPEHLAKLDTMSTVTHELFGDTAYPNRREA